MAFSTFTPLSSQVCHTKQGGVLLVTCSSLDRSFTNSSEGALPSRLFFEPLCVFTPKEMTG